MTPKPKLVIPTGATLDQVLSPQDRRTITPGHPVVQVGDLVVTTTVAGTVTEVTTVKGKVRFVVQVYPTGELVTIPASRLRAVLVPDKA